MRIQQRVVKRIDAWFVIGEDDEPFTWGTKQYEEEGKKITTLFFLLSLEYEHTRHYEKLTYKKYVSISYTKRDSNPRTP